jgi:hypothetical protein
METVPGTGESRTRGGAEAWAGHPGKVTFGQVVAANVRAERGRAGLSQAVVSARMVALGHGAWKHYQTLGKAERGVRPLSAGEVLSLAFALETTISALMSGPPGDVLVVLADDVFVGSVTVRRMAYGNTDRSVTWDGGQLGGCQVLGQVSGNPVVKYDTSIQYPNGKTFTHVSIINNPGVTVCQGGDSGSPVFQTNDGTGQVNIAGIFIAILIVNGMQDNSNCAYQQQGIYPHKCQRNLGYLDECTTHQMPEG